MDFIYEENKISSRDETGKTLAEVTFPSINDTLVNIDHTYVSPDLRGLGVADKLLTALAEKLRAEGRMAYPSCPYAVKWFGEHPDFKDIYFSGPIVKEQK
jgi:predicted GNAT family acetyltransferase